MRDIPSFSPAQLEAICKSLADTSEGLTGTEIGQILAQINVKDTDPNLTKWKRLFNALANIQNINKTGNKNFSFIKHALDPARYQGQHKLFEERCRKVNITLSYLGYEFYDDGKFHIRQKAKTLTEAEERANRLRSLLQQRNIHPDILKFCRDELLEDNCFHAVLEACKSVASKVRNISGLTNDGADLIKDAFGGNNPLIKINSFRTDTEKSEQKGFVNLAIGLFGTFRNPTSHAPKIEWPIDEQDALDIFSLISYIHRRIDISNK